MFGWVKSFRSLLSSLREMDKISAVANQRVAELAAEFAARAKEAQNEVIDVEWESCGSPPALLPAPEAPQRRGPGRPKKVTVAQPAKRRGRPPKVRTNA